jgi:hypothetical protein
MTLPKGKLHWCVPLCAAALLSSSCASPEGNFALGAAAATVLGAASPSHEIEQTYYLGIFDPREQLPPLIYRVRVRGQASFISRMRFASGWVRAELIDSLGSNVAINQNDGTISFTKDDEYTEKIQTDRGLVLYGPEGFRTAPRNHRLVIIMGTDPDGYFSALDQALGEYAKVNAQVRESEVMTDLLKGQVEASKDRATIAELESKLQAQATTSKTEGVK